VLAAQEEQLLTEYAGLLDGKVVADPSNPVGFTADGTPFRTLPEGQSQGSLVAAILPAGAHYVKAFGTLGADQLASSANRAPRRAVLFYGRSGSKSTRLIQAMTTHPALADHEPRGRTLLMVVPPDIVTGPGSRGQAGESPGSGDDCSPA